MPEFYVILAQKIIKIPDFMIFARKIYKIPEFYLTFARKMPEFYIIIARKIFFPNFNTGHHNNGSNITKANQILKKNRKT